MHTRTLYSPAFGHSVAIPTTSARSWSGQVWRSRARCFCTTRATCRRPFWRWCPPFGAPSSCFSRVWCCSRSAWTSGTVLPEGTSSTSEPCPFYSLYTFKTTPKVVLWTRCDDRNFQYSFLVGLKCRRLHSWLFLEVLCTHCVRFLNQF